jgi:hypothetical protein
MVSRSLEKMMLIAIGLSTAVIIGVPVLMYAMDTITTTSNLEDAIYAADQIHDATRDLDDSVLTSQTIVIAVPPSFSVIADGSILTISYNPGGLDPQIWSESYNHPLSIDDQIIPHSTRTTYSVSYEMLDGVIHISFAQVVPMTS